MKSLTIGDLLTVLQSLPKDLIVMRWSNEDCDWLPVTEVEIRNMKKYIYSDTYFVTGEIGHIKATYLLKFKL